MTNPPGGFGREAGQGTSKDAVKPSEKQSERIENYASNQLINEAQNESKFTGDSGADNTTATQAGRSPTPKANTFSLEGNKAVTGTLYNDGGKPMLLSPDQKQQYQGQYGADGKSIASWQEIKDGKPVGEPLKVTAEKSGAPPAGLTPEQYMQPRGAKSQSEKSEQTQNNNEAVRREQEAATAALKATEQKSSEANPQEKTAPANLPKDASQSYQQQSVPDGANARSLTQKPDANNPGFESKPGASERSMPDKNASGANTSAGSGESASARNTPAMNSSESSARNSASVETARQEANKSGNNTNEQSNSKSVQESLNSNLKSIQQEKQSGQEQFSQKNLTENTTKNAANSSALENSGKLNQNQAIKSAEASGSGHGAKNHSESGVDRRVDTIEKPDHRNQPNEGGFKPPKAEVVAPAAAGKGQGSGGAGWRQKCGHKIRRWQSIARRRGRRRPI